MNKHGSTKSEFTHDIYTKLYRFLIRTDSEVGLIKNLALYISCIGLGL